MSTIPPTAGGDSERERRAFLSHLRHELRTPLNAILGYSEMLLETIADEGPEEFAPDLNRIREAGGLLLGQVNRILNPDSVAAGLDVEAVGAAIRKELREPLSAVIGYCEILLEQAEEDGHADLLPDLERIRSSGARLSGMIEEIVNVGRGAAAGADLGTEPDTAAMVHDVVASIRSLDAPKRSEQGTGGRLLVVDDNETNRDLLGRHLKREGHVVTTAEDGFEALERLRAEPFDLVLLDLMMPRMNGYEVLRHLAADTGLRDIPVIMISALDELDSVVRCIEAGARDYLPKPFNPVILRARIGACLEQKRLRDQEIEYLRGVARVTEAAGQVEAGEFDLSALGEVETREDALGRLARVFRKMAREVRARETTLKRQVQELRVEVDQAKKARQVAEITETDYFQELQQRAARLRKLDSDSGE
jgi:DNA-binding response OmpR family regulator